jgi:hypothetical protein
MGSTAAPAVVAVNAATVAFVDELLRLPSPSAAATVVDLLYGRRHPAPATVLSHVNGGIHIPLASLLSSPSPLAALLADRLRLPGAVRADGQALKGSRATARARYRELQAAFVATVPTTPRNPAAALVRYTYGIEGRPWVWEEAAARILHRVAALNRAVLDLLAAARRGDAPTEGLFAGELPAVAHADLPDEVLDLLAAALPAVAVPDWQRFSAALHGSRAALHDDEAVIHYRSLLAEILGLHDTAGAPAAPQEIRA